jgi:hypothetical protein
MLVALRQTVWSRMKLHFGDRAIQEQHPLQAEQEECTQPIDEEVGSSFS